MSEKKRERIVDKPTKKEIKVLLKKAKVTAKEPEKKEIRKKETAKQPDKLDLILSNLKNFENRLNTDHHRLDKIENLLSKRDTDEQKKQIKSAPEELTPEEKLAQAQGAQKKVDGQQQPGQTQGQPSPEESAAQAALQLQQDVAQAQAAQTQTQQQGQQGQGGQQPAGGGLTPQNAWLLERVADAAKVIVPAVLQSKSNNTGNPLKGFFEQLKIYQGIENTVLSGFFNFMKMLPGSEREAAMSGIMTSQKVPTMTNLPHKSEIIE